MVVELGSPEYEKLEPIRQLYYVLYGCWSEHKLFNIAIMHDIKLDIVAGYEVDVTFYKGDGTDNNLVTSRMIDDISYYLEKWGFKIRYFTIEIPKALDDLKHLNMTFNVVTCERRNDEVD